MVIEGGPRYYKRAQKLLVALPSGDPRISRFDYSPGEEPTYLKDHYGIEGKGGTNIGQMIREDFQLADSSTTPGIQVADLIAGGMRRLFRGGFKADERIALLLGENMVQVLKGETPVNLVSLDQTARVSSRATHLFRLMASVGRPMLVPKSGTKATRI